MKKYKFLILSNILIALIVITGCSSDNKNKEQTVKENLVKVESATLMNLNINEEINGNIESFETGNIAPQIAGRIEKIYVEVGDKVRKGQKLVDMDSLQYLQTKIQLQNIEKDNPRMSALYGSGAISEQQYDQHKTNLDVTATALKNLHNNITLYSPVDGVVTGKYYEDKELFMLSPNASGGVGILTIMQIDPVRVFVNISEEFFPKVKNGMKADVKLDLYPDKTFAGEVYRIHPTIDPLTRTFVVEVKIPNKSLELRPGMFARVNLNLGNADRVLVSDVSVLRQQGSNERYIFIVRNDTAIRQSVITGRRVGNKIEILKGLQPSDQVVNAGHTRLQTNSPVKIVK